MTHSAGLKINIADFDNDGDLDVIDGRRDYGKEEFVIYENSDVIGHTWEVSSIPGVYAKNVINGDVVGSCSGLTPMELANLIHNFPDSDGNPFTEHLCITLTGSYDPNIKEAMPLGVSDQNFIDREDDRIKINQIFIRNTSGIKVYKTGVFDFSKRKIKIDISNLLSGIYVIEINTDIGVVFKKMIVIK